MQLSKEWKRLAGVYQRASDVVRAADYNPRISDAEYGLLVGIRENAFAALTAESQSQRTEARS